MSEYQQSETINAEAARVFDFICDIGNLPRYLPTVRNAMPQPGERVRVQGEARGRAYDSDGYYRVDRGRLRMEWGSDGENRYRGWMEVKEAKDGDGAIVAVHLFFEPSTDLARKFEEQTGDRDRTIDEGLRDALKAIKEQCEGNDGEDQPRKAEGHVEREDMAGQAR
jgi:uncharacterized protein YndB with AHSA1/START domain